MKAHDGDLRALLTTKEELVGSLAHDLKGLLSGVDGGLYLLRSGLEKGDSARVERGLGMIERNNERIHRAVASELYFVKDRAVVPSTIDAEQLVFKVRDALAGRAKELGVRMRVRGGGGSFEADELASYSLLLNLVEYALVSCSQAKLKPAPVVTLAGAVEGGAAVFEVLADGYVIDEETRALALMESYRPRGADRSHLALYVTRRLLTRQGGDLTVSASGARQSTRFEARLPLVAPGDGGEP